MNTIAAYEDIKGIRNNWKPNVCTFESFELYFFTTIYRGMHTSFLLKHGAYP